MFTLCYYDAIMLPFVMLLCYYYEAITVCWDISANKEYYIYVLL